MNEETVSTIILKERYLISTDIKSNIILSRYEEKFREIFNILFFLRLGR